LSRVLRQAPFGLAAALAMSLALTTPTLAQSTAFGVISSPNQGRNANQLLGAAAVAGNDVWSVGYYLAGPSANSQRTLAEHWNGANWSIAPTPNAGTAAGDYDVLTGVTAVSASNTWAVGYSGNAGVAADQSLVEHWDGSRWKLVASPGLYQTQDLSGVAAASASDIWAVGRYTNFSPYTYGALTAHWNGVAWTDVSNPATASLYGVTAVASNNVWAVGDSEIVHWNGSHWSISPSPQAPTGGYYVLRAVAAASANNVWAVGYDQITYFEGYIYAPLIEHWDGSSWQVVAGATTTGYSNDAVLNGVTTLPGGGVWAVGVNGGLSFVEAWNGSQWMRVSSANVGTSNNTLEAAAAVPTNGDVWAVGEYYRATSPYQPRTLAELCRACRS
jgi:hypothetical protein